MPLIGETRHLEATRQGNITRITELQLTVDNNIRSNAVSEETRNRMKQLASLLALLRMPAVVLEATEETQMNVLALAHELSSEIVERLSSASGTDLNT
ncbi:hypothetical protein ACLKMY_00650 [Paraburkholderia mimosarum]|uniref:hypothetical protein n=1 Tax=Paraburkholderia mimosarum TaxID=312026 RepID=UPI0039C4680E